MKPWDTAPSAPRADAAPAGPIATANALQVVNDGLCVRVAQLMAELAVARGGGSGAAGPPAVAPATAASAATAAAGALARRPPQLTLDDLLPPSVFFAPGSGNEDFVKPLDMKLDPETGRFVWRSILCHFKVPYFAPNYPQSALAAMQTCATGDNDKWSTLLPAIAEYHGPTALALCVHLGFPSASASSLELKASAHDILNGPYTPPREFFSGVGRGEL